MQKTGTLLSAMLNESTGFTSDNIQELRALTSAISERDIFEVQEDYVTLFDRTRSLSLHLFEHVHGESRDRGQAMVDLREMYENQGFEIDTNELPDFLPMFLEFLSMLPPEEAKQSLADTLHITSAIGERLEKRGSPYAAIFKAIHVLSGATVNPELLAEQLNIEEDDPHDLEALDKIWEEEAITFGGNAGENDCGPDRLQRRIRASQRDVTSQIQGNA